MIYFFIVWLMLAVAIGIVNLLKDSATIDERINSLISTIINALLLYHFWSEL